MFHISDHHRQILEVNRQKESETRKHMQETKDTILQSYEQGRQEAGIDTNS